MPDSVPDVRAWPGRECYRCRQLCGIVRLWDRRGWWCIACVGATAPPVTVVLLEEGTATKLKDEEEKGRDRCI